MTVPRESPRPRSIELNIAGRVNVNCERVYLKSVRDAVAGRHPAWTRSKAMALLVASDYPNKHRELAAVLVDEKETQDARMLAAANLGRIDTPAAVQILTSNIGVADEMIRAVIMASLGRIGDRSTIDLLAKASREDTGVARSAARVSAALLSHRFGLSGQELSASKDTVYLEPAPDGGFPLRLTLADAADAEYCLRCLARRPLGIEFSDRVYRIDVWRRRRMLLLNQQFARDAAVSSLEEAPAFLGIVAAADPETGIYTPTRLLLTSPGASLGLINIVVCRLHGEIVLAGEAKAEGAGALFLLRSVAGPGARPTRIEGMFKNGDLTFKSALASTAVTSKLLPSSEARGPASLESG